MHSLWKDLRYSIRVLLKSRGFTAAAIIVLALGIGANSAIFSVVNQVLLRPMPFPNPDRLVLLYHYPPQESFPGTPRFAVSAANYIDWRDKAKSFEGMAAYASNQIAMGGGERPEIVRAVFAGGDLFRVLGVQPELGSFWGNDDDQPGRGGVVVISHTLWQNRFGGRREVIGQKILLGGTPYSIVGVAPAKIYMPSWRPSAADAWIPLAWGPKDRAVRNNHNFLVAARMKPGVDVAQAKAEMDTISRQLEAAYPDDDKGWGSVVDPLREQLVGNIRPLLLVLLGAVGFVLLIACANVANLITARNLARKKELAVRAALGASRARALQQLLCESLVLSVAGGLAGLGVAWISLAPLVRYVNQQFNVGKSIPLDLPVILFTIAISIATGVLAGVWPAWRGSKTDLNDALKQGSGRSSSEGGAQKTRTVLVAVEVALSLVLLAGAGLMIHSLWLLTGVNPGFDPHNVLTAGVRIPASAKEAKQRAEFFRQAIERVRALPGVASAGLIDSLPLQGGSTQPFLLEGQAPIAIGQQPTVPVRVISTGYLKTMRIPLRRGRDFEESDTLGRPPVVLVSESMAHKYWPAGDAIGKRLTLSFFPNQVWEVIGVAADVKLDGLDMSAPTPVLYQATSQVGNFIMTVVARTSGDPRNLSAALASDLERFNPEQPVRNIQTLQEVVDASIADRSMSMWMLSAFAGLALLLAAVGLNSVLAYMVRRRGREIGIRMALGASTGSVLRAVVIDGLKPTVVGIVVGLIGAVALSSYLSSLVYGIEPTDPLTFGAVTAALTAVALLASILPAWRATRVDPIQVLRDE